MKRPPVNANEFLTGGVGGRGGGEEIEKEDKDKRFITVSTP